jgi:hypothetical protein
VPWLMPATPVFPFPIHLNQVQGHLLRLVTFRCQKVRQWLDLLGIFILAPLKEGMSRKEVTQPNALGPDLPQWLWKLSDCYNLQKVQMRVMGMVQVALLGTRRHRDETLQPIQLLPILLWFPRRWRSAWIRQSGGRSSCCWERQRRGQLSTGVLHSGNALVPQPEVPLFSYVQLGLKILGLHSWLSSVSSMFEDDKKLGE